MEKQLKKYHEYLLNLGGTDLAGEYEDILDAASQYASFEEFIDDEIDILGQDDKEQADEIKRWVDENL